MEERRDARPDHHRGQPDRAGTAAARPGPDLPALAQRRGDAADVCFPSQPRWSRKKCSAELTAASDKTLFTVYERASWRAVGTTYLTDIDHRHRSAEFGVLIGEAIWRGKGYGTEAASLMLDYAFTASVCTASC